ncbi:1,2-phenylacetyl-CoA epoxidase subunit PaaD [Kribbella sp. NPDC059898]|uniref:1,2-phenylacetyl-CoA epoxidase subunit PaaD n=1 Tax=Kribbella sp. NPDC059898 TaxID=3346995 RepID=UPI00364B357F
MVTDAAVLEAVGEVTDPEIPVLTIADLGVLRGLHHDGDQIVVTITPTYSGCPAMDLIRHEVELTLQSLHVVGRVETVLSPAWTTDWMTDAGRTKLHEYGIAPPSSGPVLLQLSIRCPLCGSPNTTELSRFASTSCKSLWRCNTCKEPFDHFKAI